MRNFLQWTVTVVTCLALSACSNHEPALERAEGFHVGERRSESQAPDAYVLFDPLCGYCAEQWRNFQPLQSQVLVKWIPVGVLGEESVGQAAILLMSEDPEALMVEHQASFASEDGQLASANEVSGEAHAAVRKNNLVIEKLGTKSVPTVVYRNRTTGELIITSGVASTSELAQAFGISDIPGTGE